MRHNPYIYIIIYVTCNYVWGQESQDQGRGQGLVLVARVRVLLWMYMYCMRKESVPSGVGGGEWGVCVGCG